MDLFRQSIYNLYVKAVWSTAFVRRQGYVLNGMRMVRGYRRTSGAKRSGVLYALILLTLAIGVAGMVNKRTPGGYPPGLSGDSTANGVSGSVGISPEAGAEFTPMPGPTGPVDPQMPQNTAESPVAPVTVTPLATVCPNPEDAALQQPDEPKPTDEESPSDSSDQVQPSPGTDRPEDRSELLEELKTELEGFLSEQKGRYGLYYKNLITGEAFGIREGEHFIAASTTKLPMNLMLYRKVAAGEVDLNDRLTYLEEDFEAGTGIIQASPYGTEYTVREAARLSIVYSDNCAINMIIRLLGIENIRKYMQDIGGTVYYGEGCPSCPYDLVVYAQELYRFYQEDPKTSGLLMEDLQNTLWQDRIQKHLPPEVKVAHKIGNYTGVLNDVAIVFADEPYALAVMSDGVDQDAADRVIAEMSKRIYERLHRQ